MDSGRGPGSPRQARSEYDNIGYHMYLKFRRVWGQKPLA